MEWTSLGEAEGWGVSGCAGRAAAVPCLRRDRSGGPWDEASSLSGIRSFEVIQAGIREGAISVPEILGGG